MRTLLVGALLLLAAGCRQQPPGTVIARVGDATLTLEDALLAVDTTRSGADVRVRAYALSWMNNELLFQEAGRRGLDRSGEIDRRLDDVRRQLVVQALLDEIDRTDTLRASDDTLRQYFAAHQGEFFLREDMAKLNIVVLNGREEASAFAAAVSGGTAWEKAIGRLRADSASAAGIRYAAEGHYYSRRTLSPPDLWKVASALGENEVSFPVRLGDAFAVVQNLASVAEGRPAAFEFVRDEVAGRLANERRHARLDALLAELRAQRPIQLMLPAASATDTTQLLPHE